MDDGGDLDCSNNNLGGCDFTAGTCPLLDDLLKDTHICTHTHTCNPLGGGPDYSHIHSCFHVHTKINTTTSMPSPPPGLDQDNKVSTDDTTAAESSENNHHTTTKKKRPSGNREAVRKYREKKKARAASLEDQVMRLTTANHQLMKRLEGQADLEAEVARLKCLLVDIRGRIEGEIGSFPYQNQNSSYCKGGHISAETYVMSPCNMQCSDQVYCLQSQPNRKCGEDTPLSNNNGQDLSGSELENMQRCFGDQNAETIKGFPSCGPGNVGGSARANRRKGGTRLPTTCSES